MEGNTAFALEAAVKDATTVAAALVLSLLHLEEVVVLILDLTITVSLVVDELALVHTLV